MLLALLLGACHLAGAQSVAILAAGTGQGLLFSHRDSCYVVLPAHVLGRERSFQLSTSAPVTFGSAQLLNLDSGHDLAVGYVEPGLEARCELAWRDLPEDVEALLGAERTPRLTRIRDSGVREQIAMRIVQTSLDELWATMAPESGVYPGTSGSILYVDGVPVGMATDAGKVDASGEPADDRIRFLRIDEIRSELQRLVQGRRGPLRARETAAHGSSECASPIPIASVRCDHATIDASESCAALGDGQQARFVADALPLTLDIELDTEVNVAIHSIGFENGGEAETKVKSVTVLVDGSSDGSTHRWRPFASRDLPPQLRAAVENGAVPRAKRIKVRLLSSWNPALPLRLGCLHVE